LSGGVLLRLIETFLRRWWLYLLPLVLLSALGVVTVASSPAEYRSSALLRAETGSLLSDITEIGEQAPFTFETPAQVTSRQVSELLRTNDFLDRVATDAQVDPFLTGLETRGDIRGAIGVSASGENLMTVSVTTGDPMTSQLLAQATIDNFVDYVIDANAIQSDTAENFLTDLADRYRGEVDASATAIDNFLTLNPEPTDPEIGRPAAEEVAISRLQSSFSSADERYRRVLGQIEEVRLGREQTEAETRQRLSIVDAPIVPTFAESGTRAAILSLGLFIIVGALISLTAVALASLLDRSLRFPAEFSRRLGVDVLATVPKVKKRQLKALTSRRRKSTAEPAASASGADDTGVGPDQAGSDTAAAPKSTRDGSKESTNA
jgi:hypothetical protein